MKESPSWGANISSSNHEITHILRSPKAHYRTHNSPSLAPEPNKLHLPSHPISLISTIILFSHLRLSLPSCLFHSSHFQVTLAHIFSSPSRVLHATAHLTLLVLIITTQTMFVTFLCRSTQMLGQCTLIGHGRFVSHEFETHHWQSFYHWALNMSIVSANYESSATSPRTRMVVGCWLITDRRWLLF